jgi:hypothetical protein
MELIGSTGQKQGEIAPNEGNSAPHTPKKNCASQTVSKLGILKCCTLHPHGSSYINQRLPLDAEIQGHPRPPKATQGHRRPPQCPELLLMRLTLLNQLPMVLVEHRKEPGHWDPQLRRQNFSLSIAISGDWSYASEIF